MLSLYKIKNVMPFHIIFRISIETTPDWKKIKYVNFFNLLKFNS